MTEKKRISIFAIAILLVTAGGLRAQQTDAENCKDHPLFSRMKSFVISSCSKNFNEHEFYLPEGQTKVVEGDMTMVEYTLLEGAPQPSSFQIRRNYGNAVKAIGGTVLFDMDNSLSARALKNGREIWVAVNVFNDGALFQLTVVEVTPMVQEVAADAMYDALSKDGFMALYINFDTGQAVLKPDSLGTVAQIAALLKGHADLKLSIEGHTDNVGSPAANKALSENRAKAVLAEVVKGGIAAARLSAVGWGQDKPIADNRSEEGRAKNRRVEIVKK
jgi:OOP family OmpA-OmpF porin